MKVNHSERKTMMKLVRRNGSRAARPRRLAASVVGAAVAIAIAAGVAAAQANAAQPVRAKLKHGVLTIDGTKASDTIALRLEAGDPGLLQVDVGDGSADVTFEREKIAEIAVDAGAGDDFVRVDERNGAVDAGIPTTIDGGNGDDALAGGSGAETLRGGEGNDSIDGNGGADVAFLGFGDDTFVWDPGDGSDVIEGEDGLDTMLFNGAAGAEQFDLSANGNRLRFFRNVGPITMDTAGVERVDVNALGNADQVTVSDLTGTDVSDVNVDLAGTLGGATGDDKPDRVVVNGTNGDDRITVTGDAGGVKVSGLATTIGILHAEAANDRLDINTLDGRDSVDPSGLAAGAIQLFVDATLVP
jgi:RTX calcium-binding nonapeptide repeat (4 copies)